MKQQQPAQVSPVKQQAVATTTASLGASAAAVKQTLSNIPVAAQAETQQGSAHAGLSAGAQSVQGAATASVGSSGTAIKAGGVLHACEAAKVKGNAAFAAGLFPKAVQHYTMALRLLEPEDAAGQKTNSQGMTHGSGVVPVGSPSLHAVLLSNRSAAFSGMGYYGKAEDDAKEVSTWTYAAWT